MQSINERFLNKFVELEKICNDMFGCQSGVTEYISQMEVRSDCKMKNSPWHNFYVKLCAYRGKRNALVHPGDFVSIGESDIEFLDKLYQDILNRRDPLCKLPKLHKANFYVDGVYFAMVNFKEGDRHIKEPTVPPKAGHVFKWENYALGNKDIDIHGKHMPITHKASFYVDDKLIVTVNFKEGDRYLNEPAVPQIDGCFVRWENYTLGDKDIRVNAVVTKKKETNFSSPSKPITQNCLTPAQIELNKFWDCFDKYLAQQGNPFSVAHVKGGKNQAAGNINTLDPMAMQTLCCQYRFRDQEIWVLVYINRKEELYDRLYTEKEGIEEKLGYKVDWTGRGPNSNSVHIIKKVFPINKPYDEMVREVFPYISGFIRVFEPYLKAHIK